MSQEDKVVKDEIKMTRVVEDEVKKTRVVEDESRRRGLWRMSQEDKGGRG